MINGEPYAIIGEEYNSRRHRGDKRVIPFEFYKMDASLYEHFGDPSERSHFKKLSKGAKLQMEQLRNYWEAVRIRKAEEEAKEALKELEKLPVYKTKGAKETAKELEKLPFYKTKGGKIIIAGVGTAGLAGLGYYGYKKYKNKKKGEEEESDK